MTAQSLLASGLAPAKLNLGLRVLRKRPDGYHDIESEMQTISIFDRIDIHGPGSGLVHVMNAHEPIHDNLVHQAASLLAGELNRNLDVDFTLRKRIPISTGLGGGSSDAATALMLLAVHWNLPPDHPAIVTTAIRTGSDVSFFLTGGRALATGRGDQISSVSVNKRIWFLVLVPKMQIHRKTATLYSALRPSDFSRLPQVPVEPLTGLILHNTFAEPLYNLAPQLPSILDHVQQLTGNRPYLSGSGPAHFLPVASLDRALPVMRLIASSRYAREVSCFVAQTVGSRGPLRRHRNPS
ncbi:4-(cytidine 5'-diphospho)-2-C-methyl-D-erythritol kinase [soil metagenome]